MRFCFFHLRRGADYLAYVGFVCLLLLFFFYLKETTEEVECLLQLKRIFPKSWAEKGKKRTRGWCVWQEAMTSSVIVNRKQKFTANVTLPSSTLAVSCCLPDFGAWEAVLAAWGILLSIHLPESELLYIWLIHLAGVGRPCFLLFTPAPAKIFGSHVEKGVRVSHPRRLAAERSSDPGQLWGVLAVQCSADMNAELFWHVLTLAWSLSPC